ncbi:MAG: class I SAM-dependent methyltransferase [Acidobacteriaceae bacterium]
MSPIYSSLHDPGGRVLRFDNRIIRLVNREGERNLDSVRNSGALRRLQSEKRFISFAPLALNDIAELPVSHDDLISEGVISLLEHEAIPFPSYPYEWPPAMLFEAAKLTLDIAGALIEEDLGLKDGTPYNILFRGTRPVFIDLLSVEAREAGDPLWLAYAQFVRMFLLPLFASRKLRYDLRAVFSTRPDGLEPEEIYRWCKLRNLLGLSGLSLVALPNWLNPSAGKKPALYKPRRMPPQQAKYVFQHMLRGLRRHLNRVKPAERKSAWSDYATERVSYAEEQIIVKQDFVAAALREVKPARVLDIGCNTGEFSLLAAGEGAEVVAVDKDEVSVGLLFQAASKDNLNVLPLVVDFANPSPPTGWMNRQYISFTNRAEQYFDLVLCLAVIHHLLVSNRIPLPEIVDALALATKDFVIAEYVDRQDPQFQLIARGRDALFTYYDEAYFEATFRRRFRLLKRIGLPESQRALYLWSKQP